MPNNYQLDVNQLDELPLDGDSASVTPPTDDFWYNYFGLQNDNIITEYVRVSAPRADLAERSFPRADGGYAETFQYRRNVISIKGMIQESSQTALETLMDQMRDALADEGSLLKIIWAGQPRYYENCFPQDIDSIFSGREHYHIDYCPFEISFVSLQPYGRDEDRTVLDAPYAVTTTTTFIVSNAGSAPTDPITTIAVVTAGSLSQLVWENLTNGDRITIADSFSDGDVIEINGEEKTVTVNGVAVSYTGVIPRAISGDNSFQLTPTGSGYSLSLSEQHYSRYY